MPLLLIIFGIPLLLVIVGLFSGKKPIEEKLHEWDTYFYETQAA